MKELSPFLIVEDQEIIAENLRRIIVNLGYPNPYIATSYSKALDILHEHKVSLILLDINLGKNSQDGIDLITEIHQKQKLPHIFITANADRPTLEKAMVTNPQGYIVKPFDKNNIFTNIERALFNAYKSLNDGQKIKYVHKGQKEFLAVDSILYLKADGVYVDVINEENKKVLLRNTFKELQKELPLHFLQIHRSLIINCNKVEAFTGQKVKIKEHDLNIGRVYKKLFLATMEEL